MPPTVFISYRRDDASAEALLICKELRARLGHDAVFLDTSSIRLGSTWPESIQNALRAAETVLVVIGPNWLKMSDQHGRRCIDSPNDWVHREVATALDEKDDVIPILVRDSRLPSAEALPDALGDLVDRQAFIIRRDHLEDDLEPLLERICGTAAPHEVPSPVSTFVGREAEIDRLVGQLSKTDAANSSAICGIRGLGGVGKTQLALAVAKRLAGRFPDGQIFVELAGLSDVPLSPDAALRTVLRALGAKPAATDDLPRLEAAYRSLTFAKRLLVVADDARDKAQVAPLAPSPGCGLIVTSRSRLFFTGMTQSDLVDLGPLSEAEAEALLVEICPRIDTAAAHIAALCGRLPLALQVSASILANDPTLGVGELVARLGSERSKLAALKAHDDPDLDVEAALALSVDRLTSDARSALAQAAIFTGSFTREAAEAIIHVDANDAGATIAALRDLYVRSLVDFDDNTKRYSLHDLTRAFASSHIPDDEC